MTFTKIFWIHKGIREWLTVPDRRQCPEQLQLVWRPLSHQWHLLIESQVSSRSRGRVGIVLDKWWQVGTSSLLLLASSVSQDSLSQVCIIQQTREMNSYPVVLCLWMEVEKPSAVLLWFFLGTFLSIHLPFVKPFDTNIFRKTSQRKKKKMKE